MPQGDIFVSVENASKQNSVYKLTPSSASVVVVGPGATAPSLSPVSSLGGTPTRIVQSTASTTTVSGTTGLVILTGSSTGQTITLVAANINNSNGKQISISNQSSVNWTIAPAGTDTIQGVNASITIIPNQSLDLDSNGTNAWVIT